MSSIKLLALPVATLTLASCASSAEMADPSQADASEASYGASGYVTLSPAAWPAEELQRFLEIEQTSFPGNPEAVGRHGAVTGSFHGLAQRAGLEALRQGGSSVDAALTTAMAQVALGGGAVISYFGIMTMVHYDAATGEIVTMNANWNTVRGETDPMSIPGPEISSTGSIDAMFAMGEPSGRSALVGGFMRGAEAAHQRYGRLPWAALFEPSIYLAEEGFPFTPGLAGYLERRKPVLERLPESRAFMTNEAGDWYEEGDHFTQPELARTLRAIAREGADYMYEGVWAQRAVAAIQADGGHMTMQDLADYEVMWVEPLSAQIGDYTLHVNGLPDYGGVNMIEAQLLGVAAGLPDQPHWSQDAESFREVNQLTTNMFIGFLPEAAREALYPGLDLSLESRIRPETAAELWERMQQGAMPMQFADADQFRPSHSDTVVAVDQYGNMTAITHSINAAVWGATGIVVDGVTISDAAVHQKAIIAGVEPGDRLPSPIEVGLLSRDGEPQVAFATMSVGLHQEGFQSLANIIYHGMTPKQAVDAPSILLPRALPAEDGQPPLWVARVMEGAFPQPVLDGAGIAVETVPPEDRRFTQGLWAGISRDPETGELRAASHYYTNAQALAD